MLAQSQKSPELHSNGHNDTAEAPGSKCPSSSQPVQSSNLFRAESLITFRWESMNALEIASVLDSTFPTKSDSSALTCEEECAMYDDDNLWMQPELLMSREVETCVTGRNCEDAKHTDEASQRDVFPTNASQPGEDCTSLFMDSQYEGVLKECEWSNASNLDDIGETTSVSTFEELADDSLHIAPLPSSVLDPSIQEEGSLPPSNSKSFSETKETIQEVESREVSSVTQCSSADTRSERTASQHCCNELDIKPHLQLPPPAPADMKECVDGRKARARRVAANQRRAGGRSKKYQPYKLIPMSSSATNVRSNRMEQFFSERPVVCFPPAQQNMQSVQVAPGARFQSAVPSLLEMNGNQFLTVNESLEEGLLERLKSSVRQLDEPTRIFIRDALYRLARSAKERQKEVESRLMRKPSPSKTRDDAIEADTNPIDRWVVNLLFCKLPTVSDIIPPSDVLFQTEATSQVFIPPTIMSQPLHQWNSCGIIPDSRLCTY